MPLGPPVKLTTLAQALANLAARQVFSDQEAVRALVRAGPAAHVAPQRVATLLLGARISAPAVARGMLAAALPLPDALAALAGAGIALPVAAQACASAGVRATLAAPALVAAFHPLPAPGLVTLLAEAGYPLAATAAALPIVVPALAAAALVPLLCGAYHLTAAALAPLTLAMAEAGYGLRATAAALWAEAPFATVATPVLVAALAAAYGPLSLVDTAWVWQQRGATLVAAARALQAATPPPPLRALAEALVAVWALADTDAPALAEVGAALGAAVRETLALLHALFPAAPAAALAAAVAAWYPPLSAAEIAWLWHLDGADLGGAAAVIVDRLPGTAAAEVAAALLPAYGLARADAPALALALAGAAFAFGATARGLWAVFAPMRAEEVRVALVAAYPPATPASVARRLAATGTLLPAAACALRQEVPSISAAQLALALAPAYGLLLADAPALAVALGAGGYSFRDTARAVQAVFAHISADTLRIALMAAYPPGL